MTRATAFFCASWGLLCLALAPESARAQVFHDDFDGTALNPAVWSVELGEGQIVVADGVATLTCTGNPFPVATTIQDPFPPGDFLVRVGLRYFGVEYCGDGFGSVDNFFTPGCRPFLLWQDSGGWYVYCGSSSYQLLTPTPQVGYHVYEWQYTSGQYSFALDGAVRMSGLCAPRPTGFFFGHPHPIACNRTDWTSFGIDFVHIEPLGATETPHSTWGSLKSVYR
jgi:hypothetical protein